MMWGSMPSTQCSMHRQYQPQSHQFSGKTKEHDLSESMTSKTLPGRVLNMVVEGNLDLEGTCAEA